MQYVYRIKGQLDEATKHVAEQLENLGVYYSATGVARLPLHYFLGHNVRRDGAPRCEATEVIDRVEEFPVEDVLEMIYDQRCVEVESALGVLLALRRLEDWRPRKPR